MPLGLIITAPLLAAVLMAPAQQLHARAPALLAGAASVVSLAALATALPALGGGGIIQTALPWIPALGLELALRLDGLAALFVLLIAGIGLLVTLYARYYLPEQSAQGRFFALMLLFETAMLGLVMADNLLLLLLFWELTTILSFLLIGYDPTTPAARRGARMALIVTASGGLALLAGFLLLGHIVGSLSLGAVLAAGEEVRADPLLLPILLLILVGAVTKSAQLPVHFWLPAAMAAPTPVSAYLHSATMVKAGIFLLARLFPVFADSGAWFPLVGGIGLATFVFGAYIALFKHDLKGLLAYSTISHLGLITFLFGLGTPLGAVAGLFHVINHAVFKASLFMAAGIIDHETGSRDLRRLRGLFRYLPITGTLAMIAAAAMAGVPLCNGFLSKEMFFSETVHSQRMVDWPAPAGLLMPAAAVLGGVLSVAYSLRFIHDAFFNGPYPDGDPELASRPHEPKVWMRLPVTVLAGLCLVIGILPQQTVAPLLALAADGMLGFTPEFHLEIWHGWSPALLMSLIAIGGGALLYAVRRPLFAAHAQGFPVARGEAGFQHASAALLGAARRFGPLLATVSLPRSAAWLIATAVGVALLGWMTALPPSLSGGSALMLLPGLAPDDRAAAPVDVVTLTGAVVVAAATLLLVPARRRRLFAVLLTAVIGLFISLAFVHFSAPDLALTQLAVELATTLLLLLVLTLLPSSDGHPLSRWRLGRDLTLAVAAGLGSAALTAGMLLGGGERLGSWYLYAAEPAAGAANVVNAILVDFRALDTLGEISVLATAAAGILVVLDGLRLRRPGRVAAARRRGGAQPLEPAHPLMLAMVAQPVLPAALLLAVFLLLRGHHAPGGGFVAGLVAGAALVLQQLAHGRSWTQQRLPLPARSMIGIGLLLSLGTGVAGLAFGGPFLTSAIWQGWLPILGELTLTSTLAFDTGVLLIVCGMLLLVLEGLGRVGELRTIGPATRPGSS